MIHKRRLLFSTHDGHGQQSQPAGRGEECEEQSAKY
jgi:hypothetical protein